MSAKINYDKERNKMQTSVELYTSFEKENESNFEVNSSTPASAAKFVLLVALHGIFGGLRNNEESSTKISSKMESSLFKTSIQSLSCV